MSGPQERRIEQLEKELLYYKSEYNDIGSRLLRLKEEQSRTSREARRSKLVAGLVREAYRIPTWDMALEEIGEPILATVADTSFCDQAAFLKCDPAEPGHFLIEHAFGCKLGRRFALADVPAFLFTAANKPAGGTAQALTELIGVPFVLWAYDAESGRALLLGKRIEGNIHRPFDETDRELVEVALAVYIDVLLRKRAENTLREAKRLAEEANSARAHFLANLSHELRTPLNAIIGFSDLLLLSGPRAPCDDERREFTRQIRDAGQSLETLAKDILDFSSLSNAKPRLRVEWVPLQYLLNTAIRAFAAQTLSSNIKIEMVAPVGLQAAIDYDRFRQILSNIIGNSLKFTPAGGQIAVSGEASEEGGVLISVHDTGIGMNPADIPKAFEPFVQLKNPLNREGAGLGLPIAKQLVEAHKGVLQVDSIVGQGTTITIILPPGSGRMLTAPAEAIE